MTPLPSAARSLDLRPGRPAAGLVRLAARKPAGHVLCADRHSSVLAVLLPRALQAQARQLRGVASIAWGAFKIVDCRRHTDTRFGYHSACESDPNRVCLALPCLALPCLALQSSWSPLCRSPSDHPRLPVITAERSAHTAGAKPPARWAHSTSAGRSCGGRAT
jgi:hypothetical protein